MPCRDYYDDHPEQYFKEATEPALKQRIAFAESALCAVMSMMEVGLGSVMWSQIDYASAGITLEELAAWYEQHKARDKKIRDAKIQKARAKLTKEEIALLGLDKAS